ncbi:hypothetical protein, partial [Shewanella sp.]|uniref:hypothetical protein n=1 Tax=Shewanella sp. TaxID=50422 RepID=UPI004047CCE2
MIDVLNSSIFIDITKILSLNEWFIHHLQNSTQQEILISIKYKKNCNLIGDDDLSAQPALTICRALSSFSL